MRPIISYRFRYNLYKLITHLFIPFATIPVGILFYYFSTATLPDKDIQLIFHGTSATWPAIATAIITAPAYYIHCIFNRSEMSRKWQLITHIIFCLLTMGFVVYLSHRPEDTYPIWESSNGSLQPFFLFTIPQIVCTHVIHWFWVNDYRKPLFLRIFHRKIISPTPTPQPQPAKPTKQKPPMTREESQRIFNEQLEQSEKQDGSILDRYFKSLDFNTTVFPPSFDGKKIWESVIFRQNVDEIAWHTTSEKTTLLARNGSQWFYLIDPETGKVTEKFEPNFHETWDNDNKVFIELSDSSLKLCQSNPIIQQAYWHYVHNKHVHSSFDPFAHYEDENGQTRLRKTSYFKSITSKDQSLIAYINKGEKYAYVEIYSMSDHRHIQTINTGVPGNHDCKFFDGNQKIIVGSDDGIIRIFDITTGELVCKLKGHTDSVFCLDINSTETELISGSADGVWKLWSMKPGDDFGLCIHTSEQFVTKYNKPIQIYHTQFSPDGLFIFVVTDIGRIQIFLRESLRLQTNLYDKYQRHSQATGEPTILSLLINSKEKCFYVGYANGKMQKWV